MSNHNAMNEIERRFTVMLLEALNLQAEDDGSIFNEDMDYILMSGKIIRLPRLGDYSPQSQDGHSVVWKPYVFKKSFNLAIRLLFENEDIVSVDTSNTAIGTYKPVLKYENEEGDINRFLTEYEFASEHMAKLAIVILHHLGGRIEDADFDVIKTMNAQYGKWWLI